MLSLVFKLRQLKIEKAKLIAQLRFFTGLG